jgi:hypothetical protein
LFAHKHTHLVKLEVNNYFQYLFNKYLKYPFFFFLPTQKHTYTFKHTHIYIYTHFKQNTLTVLFLLEAHTAPPLFLSLLIYTKTLPSYSAISQNTQNTSLFIVDSHTYTKHHHTYSITNTHVTLSMQPCCPTPKHTP